MGLVDLFTAGDLPVAVTVCDVDGEIVYMNQASGEMFQRSGGLELIGQSVLDCHPEPSRQKLADLLEKPELNCYTIEKDGARKLVYQVPWYRQGVFQGLVELILPLPAEMPHFVRD